MEEISEGNRFWCSSLELKLSSIRDLGGVLLEFVAIISTNQLDRMVCHEKEKGLSLCFWRQSRIGKKKMMKRNKRRYRQLAHWIEFFCSLVITHCVPNSLMIKWRQTDNIRLVTVFCKSVVMLQNIQQLYVVTMCSNFVKKYQGN
ncbi:hypothetical protein C5167_030606 [Papaver somniferum]|nr:hypothetical protein C5167_030606 [Papaver somniferum]